MVRLIQDLSTLGPMLITIVLVIAASVAVWLISSLQRGTNHSQNTISGNDAWAFRRNSARLRGMRHS
jgi:hypothetical protein